MAAQKGFIHGILMLILLGGLAFGAYLVTQKTNFFSKAGGGWLLISNPRNGDSYGMDHNQVYQVNSSFVSLSTYSPYGPKQNNPSSSTAAEYTISYRFAEDPLVLDKTAYQDYSTAEPHSFGAYLFKDQTAGTKFIWVDFKSNLGNVKRQSAQISLNMPTNPIYSWNKALKLNTEASGSAQYVKVPGNTLHAYRTFTIEAWIKPLPPKTAVGNYESMDIIEKGKASSGSYSYGLAYISSKRDNGKVHYYYEFRVADQKFGCGSATVSSNNGTVADEQGKLINGKEVELSQVSQWKHVVGQIKDGDLFIYENGKLVAKYDRLGLNNFCNANESVKIGAGHYGDDTPRNLFRGEIDEVRISSAQMYPNDWVNAYKPFIPSFATMALYHFDSNLDDSSNQSTKYPGQAVGTITYNNSTIGLPVGAAGGGISPTPSVTSVKWSTPYASLQADEFYIDIEGKRYYGQGSVNVTSNPVSKLSDGRHYTTLEMTWQENGTEMRYFLYFYSKDGKWTNEEQRTYNAKNPGDWIYYGGLTSKSGPVNLGTQLTLPEVFYGSDPNNPQNKTTGKIYFKNLRLQPFLSPLPTPVTTIVPSRTPTPIPSRAVTPTRTPTPTKTPTPTPSSRELLKNGGFEESNSLTGWGCNPGPGFGSCSIETNIKRTGNRSIKISSNGQNWWGFQAAQGPITTVANEKLCLSAWVRQDSLTQIADVRVAIQELVSPWNDAWEIRRAATNSWQQVKATVWPQPHWGDKGTKIQVYLRVFNARTAYLDDVSLTTGACK